MKTIYIGAGEKIAEQFKEQGLVYPHQKSSGKWGLPKSTLLDRNSENESLEAVIDYLEARNIIKLVEVESSIDGYGAVTL